MFNRLIIDGNSVYEIDEECEKRKQKDKEEKDKAFSSYNRKKYKNFGE